MRGGRTGAHLDLLHDFLDIELAIDARVAVKRRTGIIHDGGSGLRKGAGQPFAVQLSQG